MSICNSSSPTGRWEAEQQGHPQELVGSWSGVCTGKEQKRALLQTRKARTNTQGCLWVSHTRGIHMRYIHVSAFALTQMCVQTHAGTPPPHTHTSLMYVIMSPELLSALRLLQASPELSSSIEGHESCAHLLGPCNCCCEQGYFLSWTLFILPIYLSSSSVQYTYRQCSISLVTLDQENYYLSV